MNQFFQKSQYQDNPLQLLTEFLKQDQANETARNYAAMRFVGYVLDIGFDSVTIITSDPFKKAVGGVPRGSFLIMAPDDLEGLPPHFTLLRVSATAPTPLAREVQQTYFELHKKSMPELDRWTAGELQWGALTTTVLGMFYPDQADKSLLRFAGDVNNVVSAHRYKVYCPDDALLNLIVNGIVRPEGRFTLGSLRLTECQLPFADSKPTDVPVEISTLDFRGFRTAMFGKTRLGKSNVVKLIAQAMLEATKEDRAVGQLIFDVNGEYANDNPQDGNASIRSAYPDRCHVYALTPRASTPSKPLRLNFYEQPDSCIKIIASLLEENNQGAQYVKSFANVELPAISDVLSLPVEERTRPIRKIQMYWAILAKAGFPADEARLKTLGLAGGHVRDFDPHFNAKLREAAYKLADEDVPDPPSSLEELRREVERINDFRMAKPKDTALKSDSGNEMFDPNDLALLNFFAPNSSKGGGPTILRAFLGYHSSHATAFVSEIIGLLAEGQTVILDLGVATDLIRRYFADLLSREVFLEQEKKFTSNTLGNHYVQLYFEEAHNLFPRNDVDLTGVYARFAKEGAKFHIGMVYSTQSPSTINKDLLAQTENFFVAHMSSQDEAAALSRLQVAFTGLEQDILRTRTPGYMRMLTYSHRFVIPVQANRFEASAPVGGGN